MDPENYLDNPFESKLDLSGLIRYWKINLTENGAFRHFPAESLIKEMDDAHELHGPIEDLTVLEKYDDLIGLLLSVIFPTALTDSVMMAAHKPFEPTGIFATPKYLEILPFDKIRTDISLIGKGSDIEKGRIMAGFFYIMDKVYGTNTQFEIPILMGVPDKDTGLERVFKVELDYRFVDVESKGDIPQLSEETKKLLLNNVSDMDLWIKHLKPENFILKGFVLSKLVDVTDQETLSSIKYYLLKRDAVTCGVNFLTIQEKIRSLFRIPDLQLGIVFFDPHNNIISNTGISEWNSFMISNETSGELNCSYFKDSIYDKAHQTRQPVIIENLEKYDKPTRIEKNLLERNAKNIVIAPLVNKDEVVGILELVTPHEGKLNAVNAVKLEQVLPMFSAAIERVLGDLQNEVRALIQKECTAIHPSVEWKFLEAGYSVISVNQSKKKKKNISLPEIVFKDVYPIFGMSDIRNSSTQRNNAIKEDLIENLTTAKSVLTAILTYKDMPILRELIYSVEEELHSIEHGLASGSEASVIAFLKNEVNTAIRVFATEEDPIKSIVTDYFNSLDPTLGIVYDKRKAYEESLTIVNERIAEKIDNAERIAQDILPHYFEKYKTDGVEYNAYIGQSLLKEGTFDPIYLRNFRLWQLITMCNVAVDIEQHKVNMSHPLDIAQLILVHSEPLAIRFRQDEKRFDVDGAYNIRYEIVKKRIDKAHVLGTGERCTQPGKISIVYSRNEDAEEYERYLKYLVAEGYIESNIEHLELEELQGAKGLRAIRVTVNTARTEEPGNEILGEIFDTLEKI